LLSGVVLGEPEVCRGLRFMARPRASLRIVVGTDIWNPPVPKDIAGLPRLTPEYVDTTLTPRLADHGWKITAVRESSTVDIATSWARRLATGRSYVDIRAEAG
jgi:16S rRNA (adenine(1408)-N(1))-methyltransferase